MEVAPGDERLPAVFEVMRELRDHLGPDELSERYASGYPDGYRVVGLFDDGECRAAAGYRVMTNFVSGKHLYVDDLVTAEGARGRGLADRLFAWLEEEARHCGCTQFHLDSGLGEDRQDAHRFYFRHGLRIASYHFAREL